VNVASSCGANDDCCAAPTVTGGTFTMGSNTSTTSSTGRNRRDLCARQYEVTVARFRNFVNAYKAIPQMAPVPTR